MKRILFLPVLLFVYLFFGCEEKFDTSQLPNPDENFSKRDTNYLEITPPFGGFQSPVAIIIGNDQLIYVADYDSNEVVMMDASGLILQKRKIPHPVAIAQNFKLDLYVCGETIAPNGRDTIGAIYKISLARFDTTINNVDTSIFYNHDLENAPMRIIRKEPERPRRRYVGISILPGNEFLVARTGPDNSSFVDPDNRVLIFNILDKLVTPLGELVTRASGGTAITDVNKLTGIAVFPSSFDFIAMQSNEGTAYGAIWMRYEMTPLFTGWVPKYDPAKPEQRTIDFIRPYRFVYPLAAAIDRRRSDVFIVDAALDSVVKFDRNGRFKVESFGKSKSASDALPGLENPRGIAFSNDCTLYIADTGNKLIRRFKLSIQTTCF
ncbi:MAG: hypothetical protein EPO24_01600 [Bacteroidetes bacterium]|nr:MAG: hypothetical protein EPO24_01600 [Bacteroidota bacterium]